MEFFRARQAHLPLAAGGWRLALGGVADDSLRASRWFVPDAPCGSGFAYANALIYAIGLIFSTAPYRQARMKARPHHHLFCNGHPWPSSFYRLHRGPQLLPCRPARQ